MGESSCQRQGSGELRETKSAHELVGNVYAIPMLDVLSLQRVSLSFPPPSTPVGVSYQSLPGESRAALRSASAGTCLSLTRSIYGLADAGADASIQRSLISSIV